MSALRDYVGHVLDDKYRLEKLLGQGGMGAVYLATHLGTERYVALKLITPRLMRNEEFVERFKREARAAGRLRHPNVVDVTDFGFADVGKETVAYLVMEYLDGCTLADVLREEQRLPLDWVVDILEQVCSAVHEAHVQGIVHRDLKPENIWLEPNRLGGYRVKVLDFGIAKVADPKPLAREQTGEASTQRSTTEVGQGATRVLNAVDTTTAVQQRATTNVTNLTNSQAQSADFESETLLYGPAGSSSSNDGIKESLRGPSVASADASAFGASGVAAAPDKNLPDRELEDDDRTLLFKTSTQQQVSGSQMQGQGTTQHGAELTRVGAIIGTPRYMSPEQCEGKPSDARSDLYSLGVIAYQMLAGEPPFTGETATIMRQHIETTPTHLRKRTKVPKRVANTVMAALAKDPEQRPQTAHAFASSLRAQAEGVGSLYRRAFSLYSEYFPKFLKISLVAHVPVIINTVALVILQTIERSQPKGLSAVRIVLYVALGLVGLGQVIAYFLAASVISGMTAVIVTQVSAAPLRPVELRTALAVLKRRWRPFLKTSLLVTIRILLGYLVFCIGGIVMTARYALYAPVVLMEGLEKKAAMKRARELAARSWRTVIIVTCLQFVIPFTVSALFGNLSVSEHQDAGGIQTSLQPLRGLVNIIIVPLLSIVPALLYLKMRQLGGETLRDALSEIEQAENKDSQWQQRMRTRLTYSSRQTPVTGPRTPLP
jgi:serine/threonine protein kinase